MVPQYLMAMNFSQLQAREAIGLSSETIRHWRMSIPYLNERQGRKARFSFGDLVALGVLRCLIDDLGLSIGQFASSGIELFNGCNYLTWIDMTGAYVLVRPTEQVFPSRPRREPVPVTVSLIHEHLNAAISRPCIVTPLDPIAHGLRQFLFGATAETQPGQAWLPFPPMAIPSEIRASTADGRHKVEQSREQNEVGATS
jgi:hypothetical protein